MSDPKDDKAKRLADALRDNLRRRKAQAKDVRPADHQEDKRDQAE